MKLDFEKAYDRVFREFLHEILDLEGFSPMIAHHIMQPADIIVV
jgi:hypothetical protein